MLERFSHTEEVLPAEPGVMNSLRVTIYEHDKKIGEYIRYYPTTFNTFVPFKQRVGDEIREYALFSDNYTCTSVMRLPSCEVIAEEPPHVFGFCPVDYYVPYQDPWSIGKDLEFEGIPGTFGFVAGCIWGDDSSWKIQYLDLSEIEDGKIHRTERFGYIELPDGMSLKQAVDVSDYAVGWDNEYNEPDREPFIAISCKKSFSLDDSERN